MAPAAVVSRVIVLVLDGLRADAIPLYRPPVLGALLPQSAWTLRARTVQPSVTSVALTSLLTGVGPDTHGVRSDRIGLPPRRGRLTGLPAWLARSGITTRAMRAEVPWAFRRVAQEIAARLGAGVAFQGRGAADLVQAMLPWLESGGPGLFLAHWPDADLAGHAEGWTSPAYVDAIGRYDEALGHLVSGTGVLEESDTVLIVIADHGGGGTTARQHASNHPQDLTIPMIFAGGPVVPGPLSDPVSLLDVPATIPWLFGMRPPPDYQGRILHEVRGAVATGTPTWGVAA